MSDWFDGLKCAESQHLNHGFNASDLIELIADTDNLLPPSFIDGFYDYIDHLKNRLEQMNDSCD